MNAVGVRIDDRASRALQARIDGVRWYHEFDFPNGLRARKPAADPDVAGHRLLWRFIELDKLDLAGKSVLDIGCWDGYWSFYAERRGARRVLATDDTAENWGCGDGLRLARELFGSRIETRLDVSVYALDRVHECFDVIFFPRRLLPLDRPVLRVRADPAPLPRHHHRGDRRRRFHGPAAAHRSGRLRGPFAADLPAFAREPRRSPARGLPHAGEARVAVSAARSA